MELQVLFFEKGIEQMEYTVNNRIRPAVLGETHLGGLSKTLSDRFFEERIFSDFARNVIYQEAEDAFKNQLDDEQFFGIWQGEFWGKWVISAAEVCKYTGREELRTFLQNAAHKLLTYAREDGYLNTYKDSLNVFRVDPLETKRRCNKTVDWNWNIWCRKYTLWGLLSVYELTGDKEILTGASRLADHLIDELAANGIELSDTGTFAGMPSCSILKPMLILYRATDDRKYLDFCIEHIANRWEREDGTCPNLITNALGQKRLTEWYERSDTWAKAYEMMSCYEGLCELYRYTNEEKYLKACECIYEVLKAFELNPAFSVAYNDVFANAADEINLVSEPCDAIHWMRLCYELYTLTGDVKYIDSIELTYYNAMTAGIYKDGKWGARAIRGTGSPMWSETQANMKHQHCCVNNVPRALVRIAETAVMQDDEFLYVNLYEEADVTLRYNGGSAKITVGDTYFTSGKADVTVIFDGAKKALRFRVPAWCEHADLTVDGKTVPVASGYVTVAPSADTCTVSIDFYIGVVIRPFAKPVPQHTELINGKPHWKLARWINKKAPGETTEDLFLRQSRATLMYGPLLLARSKMIGSTEEEMFASAPVDESFDARVIAVRGACDLYRLSLDLELKSGDTTVSTTVCDFGSAGNEKLTDNRYYSMYF